MRRNYLYKGFEVNVEIEPVWDIDQGITLLRSRRFIAILSIKNETATHDIVTAMRHMADGQRPYPTEADALMAGYSAAQRLIDDTQAPRPRSR